MHGPSPLGLWGSLGPVGPPRRGQMCLNQTKPNRRFGHTPCGPLSRPWRCRPVFDKDPGRPCPSSPMRLQTSQTEIYSKVSKQSRHCFDRSRDDVRCNSSRRRILILIEEGSRSVVGSTGDNNVWRLVSGVLKVDILWCCWRAYTKRNDVCGRSWTLYTSGMNVRNTQTICIISCLSTGTVGESCSGQG